MSMGFVGNVNHCISSFWLCFITLKLHFEGSNSISSTEIDRHLELGKELLTRGQFSDALTHFHAAIEGDPTNYASYYRRATAYLALAKSKSALPDLNKVIELKPDFLAARIQRGAVFIKQGKLDDAHIDFEAVLRRDPYNPDASQYYNMVDPLKRDIQAAYVLIEARDYYGAINLLSRVLEVCPWDAKLHEMRADCYIELGDITKAIHDIKPTTKLRNDNTEAYYKLSALHYQLGETEEALQEIRECLKLDPDHALCFPFYKKVKKLAGQMKSIHEMIADKRYGDCLEKTLQMLKTEGQLRPYVFRAKAFQCQCHLKSDEISEAIKMCSEALSLEDSAPVLCDRAEAYLANEQYDDAIRDYDRATDVDPNLNRAQEGLKRAQKLQKQSKKRDYYKILGVKRTDNKRTITKAYRKLAQKWHPDNFQEGEEKKAAEKKFIDIASAKEVLTDPEKREKYDNGEDPLDPESQAGQGFNPFGQGFNPFGGGGPFQFKFHFN